MSTQVVSADDGEALLFGRFRVLAELGTGGFGRVLHCFDRETRSEVALKELRRFGADALLQFKNEFRLLSDVTHPNLVRLGELFEGDGRWAFSLEYVPGTDVLSWVRPDEHTFDESRLRRALGQLAQGLSALHSLGLLHRDVKPANVRVTPEGRVVLLDFGLVTQLGPHLPVEDAGLGTVAYMAPEQAGSQPVGAPADFYALGALLYEALTGELPFQGNAMQILLQKAGQLPRPPSFGRSGVPAELERLCLALMQPDPDRRAGASAVLELLGDVPTPSLLPAARSRPTEIFMGRGEELDTLAQAHAHAREQGLKLVLIEGESGIGKSTLVHRFVAERERHEPDTLVLAGRCHAAEQVPFKAFDGGVDALVRFLRRLDAKTCAALLPARAELLPQLFPALRGVKAIERAWAGGGGREHPERFVLFQTFAALLANIAATRSVLITIDDLQWSDLESLVLLEHLLESQVRPRALVVATVRPVALLEDAVGKELRELLVRRASTRVVLSGLSDSDARALGAALLSRSVDDTFVRSLGRETLGHPLFLVELAHGALEGDATLRADLGLDRAIMERVERLPDTARTVLDLLSVEGAPLPQPVMIDALGAQSSELAAALATLRVGRLLRPVQRNEFVCYHDRIRETVLAALAAEPRAVLHRRLAQAFQGQAKHDAARLARHWLAAGEVARALPWLEQAAREAEAKSAYERAVEHYRTMLAHPSLLADRNEGARLWRSLGDALARAGRYVEASDAFVQALEGAPPEQHADLRVRAAQQLLQAGSVQAGVDAARKACEAAGLAWPQSTRGAVARLLWHRLCVKVWGLDAEPRALPASDPKLLAQLDVLWRLAQPLAWGDLPRGAELIGRHLRLALKSGDARHIALGLYLEASLCSMQRPESPELDGLREAAAAWAAREGSDEVRAYGAFVEGSIALFTGKPSVAQFQDACRLYEQHVQGEHWLHTNARGSLLGSLYNAGRHEEIAKLAESYIDEAVHSGDRFALTSYTVVGFGAVRHLMRDRPDLALAELDEAMEPWRAQTFGVQHMAELVARSNVFMYQGGRALADYWADTWPRVRNMLVVRSGLPAEVTRVLRTMAALHAAYAEGPEPDLACLRDAHALRRQIGRARTPMGRTLSALLTAQLAFSRRDEATVRAATQTALSLYQEPDHLPASLSGLIAAAFDGRGAFDKAHSEALHKLAAQGYVRPERVLNGWFPVLPALVHFSRR